MGPDFFRKTNRLERSAYDHPARLFVTVCTSERVPYFLASAIVRPLEILLRESAKVRCVEIDAYCFMPDHLHVLATGPAGGSDVLTVIDRYKQRSGFSFRQRYRRVLWQRSYHDHVLRREEETQRVAEYILNNPVRKGLCEEWYTYPYSWSRWHARPAKP